MLTPDQCTTLKALALADQTAAALIDAGRCAGRNAGLLQSPQTVYFQAAQPANPAERRAPRRRN